MKKFMDQDAEHYSEEERLRFMIDNADDVEKSIYFRDLDQPALDIKREVLSTDMIKLSELEDELDNIKADYKAKMKPLKENIAFILQQVKTRKEEVAGTLYHHYNHAEGMCETYDETGEMVSSRRLRPNERQTRIPGTMRKIVNGE